MMIVRQRPDLERAGLSAPFLATAQTATASAKLVTVCCPAERANASTITLSALDCGTDTRGRSAIDQSLLHHKPS
jgi:hypothetical protein